MKAEMTKQTTRVDTLSLELQTYKDALSKMKWEFSLVDSGRNPKINKSDSLSHHP